MSRPQARSAWCRLVRLALWLALAAAVVTLLGGLWLTQTGSGRQLLASVAVRAVNSAIPGHVALRELAAFDLRGSPRHGDLRLRVELRGIEAHDPSGARVARLEQLELHWQPLALLSSEVRINLLLLTGLELNLQHRDEPGRGLVAAFAPAQPKDEAPAAGPTWDVRVERFTLDAPHIALPVLPTLGQTELRALRLDGDLRIEQGQVQAHLARGGVRWLRGNGDQLLQLDTLRARWPLPQKPFEIELALQMAGAELHGRASGVVPAADDWKEQPLEVQLRLQNVHPNDLSAHWGVRSSLPQLRGPWDLEFVAQGSVADARGMVTVQTPAGELRLPWTLEGNTLRWRLRTPEFDPNRLLAQSDLPRPLRIDADIAGDLRLPSATPAPIPLSFRARTSLNGQPMPELQASAKLQADGVRNLRLTLEDDASELSLTGELPQSGERRADLTWELDAATVGRVLAAFGAKSPLTSGRLSGSLALRRAADWSLQGSVSGSRFRAGSLALDALDAEVDVALQWTDQVPWPSGHTQVRLAGLRLPGTPHVLRRLSFTARGSASRYQLHTTFDAGGAASGRAALSLAKETSGALSVAGQGSGKLFAHGFRFALKRTTVTDGSGAAPNPPRLALSTRGLVLELAGQRVSLAGSYRPQAMEVRVHAQRLDLARLQAVLSASGLAGESEVSISGALSLDAQLSGKPQRPIVDGQLLLEALAARWADGRRSPPLDAKAQLDLRAPEGRAEAELTLTSDEPEATAQAGAALRATLASEFSAEGAWHEQVADGSHRVAVELEHLDSAWLEAWLSQSLPIRGSLRGSADAEWSQTPRFDSQFTARVEGPSGQSEWRVRPSLDYDGSEARLHVEVDDAAGELLNATGSLQAALDREALLALRTDWPSLLQHGYRFELSIPSREVRALPFVRMLLEPPLPPVMVQLEANVEQQPRREPRIDVRLLAQQLDASEPVAGCRADRLGAFMHLSGSAGQLRAKLDAARGTQQLAQVDLQAPFSVHALLAGKAPNWDRQRLTARVRRLPLTSLPVVCRLASGTLSLDAVLEAPLGSSPSGQAHLWLKDFTLAQASLDVDARVDATPSELQLKAQVRDSAHPQHISGVTAKTEWTWKAGQIELSPTAPLLVSAAFARLPLAPLIPRASGFSHVAGTIDGRARLSGSLLLPELAGELELNDVALTFTDLAQPLHDIRGRLVFSDQDLRVERLIAKDGAGTLEVNGRARLDGAQRVKGTARVQLDEFPLRQNGQVAATVTGQLGLSAEHRPAATRVRLRIEELDTYLESYQQRGGLALAPHPDVVVDGKSTRTSADPPEQTPSRSGAASRASNSPVRTTRIDLESSERFWIKRDDFALRLMADLQMEVTPAGAQVGGDVIVDRGYIDLFGKVFDVAPGGSSLRFTKTAVPDPVVRLSASHENRRTGDVVTVLVSGRASTPNVQFQVNGRAVEAGAAVGAIYGSARTSNTQASAKAQAASVLAGVTAGLLATTARRELGGLTPILMIEAGDGEQQARVRAGFEFDSLVPKVLRDVITGVYFEGIVATESTQASSGRSTQRTGAGALLELYFPHHLFTSGQYGPGTTWSLDLGWQL